jgi:hypothetical protein
VVQLFWFAPNGLHRFKLFDPALLVSRQKGGKVLKQSENLPTGRQVNLKLSEQASER